MGLSPSWTLEPIQWLECLTHYLGSLKRGAATSLTTEDEDSLLDEGPTSEFDPAETIANGDEDDDSAELASLRGSL